MTEKIDNKKLVKLKERVYDLLEKNRCNEDNKDSATHQSYGLFRGTFSLDKVQRKEFATLYTKAINAGVTDFSILERQKEFAPIIIDVDLEMPVENYENGDRLYDEDMIKNISEKYLESIRTYLDVPDHQFKLCLFEKKKPTVREDIVKDGFHLMFPDLCVQTKVRHLLRYKVVKMCEEEETFDGFLNGPDKIIDKAVVSANGWFLYGSTKPNAQPYTLSKIFDGDLNVLYDHGHGVSYDPETGEESEQYYDYETLVKFFSVQIQTILKNMQHHYKMNLLILILMLNVKNSVLIHLLKQKKLNLMFLLVKKMKYAELVN